MQMTIQLYILGTNRLAHINILRHLNQSGIAGLSWAKGSRIFLWCTISSSSSVMCKTLEKESTDFYNRVIVKNRLFYKMCILGGMDCEQHKYQMNSFLKIQAAYLIATYGFRCVNVNMYLKILSHMAFQIRIKLWPGLSYLQGRLQQHIWH